jgi:hypothetical protein
VEHLSAAAFAGPPSKERRKVEAAKENAATDAGAQEPPVKSKKYDMKRTTAAEDWQRILQVPRTEQDRKLVARL